MRTHHIKVQYLRICDPSTLNALKREYSIKSDIDHSPHSLAITANPSQIGFFGESSMFPIMGYSFGPGGYGGRLGARRLRSTARAIPTATTTTAGRTNPSGIDMVDSGEQGGSLRPRWPRPAAFKIPGLNGLVRGSDPRIAGRASATPVALGEYMTKRVPPLRVNPGCHKFSRCAIEEYRSQSSIPSTTWLHFIQNPYTSAGIGGTPRPGGG